MAQGLTLTGCRVMLGDLERKVDIRLPGKGDSNSHGVRPVLQIISMITWICTSRLSIILTGSWVGSCGAARRGAGGLGRVRSYHSTRHTSHKACHQTHMACHTTHIARRASHIARHATHLARHKIHIARNATHIACHTTHSARPVIVTGWRVGSCGAVGVVCRESGLFIYKNIYIYICMYI